MRVRHVAAATIAFVVLAGCSGGDDSADTTVSPTSSTDPGVTTEMTTTPTVESSTTAVTTTVATTQPETTTSQPESTTTPTSPSTTSSTGPVTTVDPNDRVANVLAMIDVVERSFLVYNAALNDPFNDEKVAVLEDVYTPRLLEGWMNIIADYRQNGYRSVPNPEVPARYDVDVNSVQVNLRTGVGSVQACHLDTSIKVEVGGNADGSDRVIEDEVSQQVEQLDLVRDQGVWKVNGASRPDESEVVTPCG